MFSHNQEITLTQADTLQHTWGRPAPVLSWQSDLAPRASFNKFSTIEVIQILLVTVVYVPLSHNPGDHDDRVSTIVKTQYQQLRRQSIHKWFIYLELYELQVRDVLQAVEARRAGPGEVGKGPQLEDRDR